MVSEQDIIEAVKKELSGDTKMGTMDVIALALKVFDGLLQKSPDFEQRKRKDYFKLRGEYENELRSSTRDDNRVDNLRDELLRMVDTFSTEIFGGPYV